MNKIELLENLKTTRFLIDNKEYLRINGVWFKYEKEEYKLVENKEFEEYYNKHFAK